MAATTMTYVGPADGQAAVTFTHTGTIADTSAPMFFACYTDVYGGYFDNILNEVTKNAKDSEGNANAPATDAQIYERFAQGLARGVAANVTRYAQQKAVEQALAAVAAQSVTQTA